MITYAVHTPADVQVSPTAEQWLWEIVDAALTVKMTPARAAEAFAETLRQIELHDGPNWTPPTITCPDAIEHRKCESTDCERIICPTGPCEGFAELACGHDGHILCDEHRMDCIECVRDARAESSVR